MRYEMPEAAPSAFHLCCHWITWVIAPSRAFPRMRHQALEMRLQMQLSSFATSDPPAKIRLSPCRTKLQANTALLP